MSIKVILLALSVFAVRAEAWWEYSTKMIQHPLRTHGTNRVNLAPLFTWINSTWNTPIRDSAKLSESKPPMPQWKPVRMFVKRVHGNGIVGQVYRERPPSSKSWGMIMGEFVFVKNYPRTGVADGDKLELVALEAGTTKATDHRGEMRTLKTFDGGLPYVNK